MTRKLTVICDGCGEPKSHYSQEDLWGVLKYLSFRSTNYVAVHDLCPVCVQKIRDEILKEDYVDYAR